MSELPSASPGGGFVPNVLKHLIAAAESVITSFTVLENGNDAPASIADRDRALAMAFKPHELVWLVHEQYDTAHNAWIVDVVRQTIEGRWMRQRYRYDGLNRVIYFLGEHPVSDDDLTELRRTGTVFPVDTLQQAQHAQEQNT